MNRKTKTARTPRRTKTPDPAVVIAKHAAEALAERVYWARPNSTPATAEILRRTMMMSGLGLMRDSANAHHLAVVRADLHRFVDALAEADLFWVHMEAAALIRFPMTDDPRHDYFKEELPEPFAMPEPDERRTARVPKVFRALIDSLDM